MQFLKRLKQCQNQSIRDLFANSWVETDLWGGIDETGAWVWTYDIGAAANRLHNIIYGEDYTAPTTDTTTPETGTENTVVDNSAQTQPAETPPAEENSSNDTTTDAAPKQSGVTVDQMMQ